jgi:hypothetical protein
MTVVRRYLGDVLRVGGLVAADAACCCGDPCDLETLPVICYMDLEIDGFNLVDSNPFTIRLKHNGVGTNAWSSMTESGTDYAYYGETFTLVCCFTKCDDTCAIPIDLTCSMTVDVENDPPTCEDGETVCPGTIATELEGNVRFVRREHIPYGEITLQYRINCETGEIQRKYKITYSYCQDVRWRFVGEQRVVSTADPEAPECCTSATSTEEINLPNLNYCNFAPAFPAISSLEGLCLPEDILSFDSVPDWLVGCRIGSSRNGCVTKEQATWETVYVLFGDISYTPVLDNTATECVTGSGLPNPDACPDATYCHACESDTSRETLQFTCPGSWTYFECVEDSYIPSCTVPAEPAFLPGVSLHKSPGDTLEAHTLTIYDSSEITCPDPVVCE